MVDREYLLKGSSNHLKNPEIDASTIHKEEQLDADATNSKE
ncbi:hypothetical protein [Rummeliibacillus pycnus]